EVPRLVERNEHAVGTLGVRGDDGERLRDVRIDADIHAHRAHRREVTNAEARRDRGVVLREVRDRREIRESLQLCLPHDGAIDEERALELAEDRVSILETRLDERCAAERARLEVRIRQPGYVGVAVDDRRGARTGDAQRLWRDGEDARPELILTIAAN